MMSPLGLMMEASVEPAPRSRIASGRVVPGVVSAPRMAASASAAADLHVDIELLLDFAGDHCHLQAIRFHHRGDADGLLQRELPGQTAGNAHRYRGINGQQVLNKYFAARLVGQLGHGLGARVPACRRYWCRTRR